MKILGLTGGSGTGKSAACTAFARLGCGVIDADATYRTLCDTCEPMLKEIQNVFGDVFSTDGKLDRKKLGAIVFADAQKLQQLNAITHPYIRQAARDAFAAYSKRGCLLCIYDAPVLFEGQMETLCDKTCAVLAARNTRIDAQKDDAFYRERCDYIVQNDADLDTLYTQVRKIYEDMVRK